MSQISHNNTRDCPWCGEEIKAKAIICRYCNRDVTPEGELAAEARRAQTTAAPQSQQRQPSPSVFAPPAPAAMADSAIVQGLARSIPASLMRGIMEASVSAEDAERRPIAVLFADLSGYTSMIEELGGETIGEMLDEFYRGVRLIVAKYDGLAEEFIGDEAMAIFGAPRAHGDDPERAIRAALEIRDYVRELGKRRGLKLDTHSGIAYGEVVLRRNHLDNQTIGDATNLAARLRAAARDGEVLVDHRIYRQARTTFDWVDRGEMEIKGKRKPVRVHLAVAPRKQFAKVMLGERIEMAPLAGRQAELKELREAAMEAAKGAARTAVVLGEAGIGKSRLIYELYHSLPEGRFNWFTGRCLAFGSPVPFLPFTELLRSALGYRRDETPDAKGLDAALGRLCRAAGKAKPAERKAAREALAHLFGHADAPNALLDLHPHARHQRVVDAICLVLGWAGAAKPVVAVLEDFHWADADSRRLFTDLQQRLAARPILFLLASRPPMPAEASGGGVVVTVRLKELNDRDSRALLRALLRAERLPAKLVEKILCKAEGNPYFLEEVLLELEEQKAIVREGAGYRLLQPPESIEIPDSVEAIVLARLDRLERGVKRVLQCASAIGQDFRYALLRHVTQMSEQLEDFLVRLIGDDYILQSALTPELVYIFRNLVLRDVAYGTLLQKQRGALHGKIASAIEEIFADRTEEFAEFLAFHYERGGVRGKAAEYLRRAGLKCERLYANHAAADYFERLKKTIDADGADAAAGRLARIDACLRLGELYRLTGQVDLSILNWQAALDALKRGDAAALGLRGMLGLAEARRLAGNAADGVLAAKQALKAARKHGEAGTIAAACNMMGHFERVHGRPAAAAKLFEEVLAIAHTRGDGRAQYQALNHLGILHMGCGRSAEAAAAYEKAHALARELGLRDEQAQISLNIGLNFVHLGDSENAETALMRALKEAKKSESERGGQLALLALADLALKRGAFAKAARLSAHLRQRNAAAPYGDVRLVALTNEARAWVALGKFEEARANLDAVAASQRENNLAVALLDAMAVEAEWLLARGEHVAAAGAADKFLEKARSAGDAEWMAPALELAARTRLATSRNAEAAKLAGRALRAARENNCKRDEAWSLWTLACSQNGDGAGKKHDAEGTEAVRAAVELARQVGDAALLKAMQKT